MLLSANKLQFPICLVNDYLLLIKITRSQKEYHRSKVLLCKGIASVVSQSEIVAQSCFDNSSYNFYGTSNGENMFCTDQLYFEPSV